ncbi:hypothetical protein [Brevibacillus sp. SKDU10]|nr:hypothetical protein [Brevibacillus sp. SKDU10]
MKESSLAIIEVFSVQFFLDPESFTRKLRAQSNQKGIEKLI